MDEQRAPWPERLYIVRHGESAGNVARAMAEKAGHLEIELAHRDMDVPLSPRGVEQADALGRWFAKLPPAARPTVVMTSPYVRAVQTAARVQAASPTMTIKPVVDERLREKEFGALERLTRAGIAARLPHEDEQFRRLGKFYYRPPGGESWCDVILRLRSVLHHLQIRHQGASVLIVAHQVTVLCLRYLLEELGEQRILEIDAGDVANCSVTSYRVAEAPEGRRLVLDTFNFVAPIESEGADVTTAPDAAVGAR
jgi:broad specificity phosphatase PhoE